MATRASHRRAEAAEEPEFRHGDVFYVYTRRGFVRDHCLNSAILATPNGLLGGKRGRSFSRRRVHHDATMPLSGFLVSKIDQRVLMSIGFAATATALYYMTTHLTLGMDFQTAAMLR